MPFPARHRFRRGRWPALLLCLAVVPFLAGCAENRDNLIPEDTSKSVIETLNEVDRLVAEGHCFKAQEVAFSAQDEIERLGGEIDRGLKRSLIDGVVRLQAMLGDGEFCTDVGQPPPEEDLEIDEDPVETEGSTGVTGTTGSDQNTTGDQGQNTDENQDSDEPQGNGNNRQDPVTTPPDRSTDPPPTQPTQPTNPATPPAGPGSGGLGPG